MSLGAARLVLARAIRAPGIPPAVMRITAPNPSVTQEPIAVDTVTALLSAPNPSISIASATWPNGFLAYRDIIIPAHAHGGTISRLVILFDETLQSLRQTTFGGRLQSADAWDVRFTYPDAGLTKLDHELAAENSATGLLRAWVAVSTTAGQRAFLRVYYGKPVAATEENPVGLWGAAKCVLDCRTGADRSAANFDLTPANIAAGTLIGDAGDFAGNSVAVRADASSLAGMTVFTLQALIQADPETVGTNRGVFCVNTPSGAPGPAALTLFFLGSSSAGVEMVQAKCKTAAGNAFIISQSNQQSIEPTLLHAVFEDGQRPKIYVDGHDVSGSSGAVQTGGLLLGTGGAFLGAGAYDGPAGGWEGLIDELRLWPFAHGGTRIAAEALSYLQPTRFYAIGGENLGGDTNLAPVAPPMEVAGEVGTAETIDVAANGWDPEGGALTIAGTPTTTLGAVTVAANKLSCSSTASGLAIVSYLLSDPGGKTASGRVFLSWVDPIPTTPVEEYPPPGDFAVRRVTSLSAFETAYTNSQPGDHVVVAAGVNIPAITLSRGGTVANPIVIRAETNQGASFIGRLSITASNLFLWGFSCRDLWMDDRNVALSRVTFRRMRFDGTIVTGGTYITGEIYDLDDSLWQYCTFSNAIGGIRFNNRCRRGIMQFCHWLNIAGGDDATEALIVLEGGSQHLTSAGFLFEDLLFENCNQLPGENETISNKSSGNIYRRVQFHNCRTFSLRFGTNCQVLGCRVPANTNDWLNVRGQGHIINNLLGTIICADGDIDSAAAPFLGADAQRFPNSLENRIIGGGNSGQTGGDSLIQLGGDGRAFDAVGTIIEGRGLTPNVFSQQGGRNPPTITATTTVPLIGRPNFATGLGIVHPDVGVWGGL